MKLTKEIGDIIVEEIKTLKYRKLPRNFYAKNAADGM